MWLQTLQLMTTVLTWSCHVSGYLQQQAQACFHLVFVGLHVVSGLGLLQAWLTAYQ